MTIDASGMIADFQGITSRVQSGLESPDHVSIMVPSNSPAGKYAGYIHDEKGSKWFKRGVGTIAKGPQADEKFIPRAIKAENASIIRTFQKAVVANFKASGRGNAMLTAYNRVGIAVAGVAKRFAPRSPTAGQYADSLKTAAGRKRRKAGLKAGTIKGRRTPGALQTSVEHKVNG